jgi:hypothetical protein
MTMVRAVRWYRDLARLGVHAPFFVIHDLGLLYAVPREQLDLGPRVGFDAAFEIHNDARALVASYRELVFAIAESYACTRASTMRIGDDLVVVVVARLLTNFGYRSGPSKADPALLPFDPSLFRDLDAQLPTLFRLAPRTFELGYLEILRREKLHILTLSDALDVDTLQLLGMFGTDPATGGTFSHVDLLAALMNPASAETVSFSLELLPSVLSTHRSKATGTHAIDGYAGLGNRGSVDSLVLTELAWDDDEFARRMVEGETLFYTRERAPNEARRLHYVLIDASASMRGDRQVFARGLSIALAKKLQLAGEDVWMRFFDSRLYDVHRGRGAHFPTAYLLGFQGERGRHPARVFAQLATELELLRRRDQRDPVVHLVTHAALHVPKALVEDVRRHAHVFGIFIAPSGGAVDLDYLDLLDGHAMVDHATLGSKAARAAAAMKIVNVAAAG